MTEPLTDHPGRRRAALALAAALVLGGVPGGLDAADAAIWPVVEPTPTVTPPPTSTPPPATTTPPGTTPLPTDGRTEVDDPEALPLPPSEDEVRQAVNLDVTTIVDKGMLGPAASVRIVDVESGRNIYSSRSATPRIAASTTKLFTATAALASLGLETRFPTVVERKGSARTVTLVSGGDPRMTNTKLRLLAKQTAAALKSKQPARTKVKGKLRKVVYVRLDDSVFTGASKLRTWRKGGYGLGTIQPVRGTARTTVRSSDSAASAARYFAKRLDSSLGTGWVVEYRGAKTAPAKARVVARVDSDTVHTLVKRMLLVSDNQVAEVLSRHVARSEGYSPSFAGGVKGTRKVMRRLGVDLGSSVLADGSGLSAANKISPAAVVNLLSVAAQPDRSELRALLYEDWSLPLAGRTGTLAYRFTGKAECARGAVVAKTGSLDWEIALSGYTVGEDGRLKAFSIVANRLWTSKARDKARATADRIAATVNGCV